MFKLLGSKPDPTEGEWGNWGTWPGVGLLLMVMYQYLYWLERRGSSRLTRHSGTLDREVGGVKL